MPALVEMLESIRPKNDDLELTGMLLYSGGSVIQTLEGPEASVESVFASIRTDPRHTEVVVLLRERIEARSFPAWSMGFQNISEREIHDIASYADFTQAGLADGLGPQSSSAFRLLELFRDNIR